MHPILADPRRLLWYELAWLAAGVGIAALLRLTGQAEWSGALEFALPICLVWSFVAVSSYYVCRSLPWRHARFQSTKHRQGSALTILQVIRVEVIHDGYPVIWPLKLLRAVEPRRCHAHHYERIFAEPHGGPDDAGIGVECGSPKTIAQHHIWR